MFLTAHYYSASALLIWYFLQSAEGEGVDTMCEVPMTPNSGILVANRYTSVTPNKRVRFRPDIHSLHNKPSYDSRVRSAPDNRRIYPLNQVSVRSTGLDPEFIYFLQRKHNTLPHSWSCDESWRCTTSSLSGISQRLYNKAKYRTQMGVCTLHALLKLSSVCSHWFYWLVMLVVSSAFSILLNVATRYTQDWRIHCCFFGIVSSLHVLLSSMFDCSYWTLNWMYVWNLLFYGHYKHVLLCVDGATNTYTNPSGF